MHFTDGLRGFLFPVEMQHLPQLMSLFPVCSFHPALLILHYGFYSFPTPADTANSLQLLNSHIISQQPIVMHGACLIVFIVWSCCARDSVASKTYKDCDRLCLRWLYIPLNKASAARLASRKVTTDKKIPLGRSRQGEVHLSWDYREEEAQTEQNGMLRVLVQQSTS